MRRGRGTDEQIDIGEPRPALVVVQRLRVIALGQGERVLVRAIRDDRRAHPFAHEALERELRHLACAQHHRMTSAERAEDLGRELHGSGAGRRRTSADTGLVAHATTNHQRRLKEPAEHRPRGTAASLPRVAHLAMNLRLAEDHGVDAGGDAKEMRDGIPIASHVAEGSDVLAE